MSSKLSVCLYTALVDFTVTILLILGCIMTIYYKQINVAKTFPDSCSIISSTTVTAIVTTTTTTTSTTTTTTTITAETIITNTATLQSVEVGTPCNINSDCLGSSVNGISTANVFQTTQCGASGLCECLSPYSDVLPGPPYRCVISNGVSGTCTDDIECSGKCQTSQNKCIAQ